MVGAGPFRYWFIYWINPGTGKPVIYKPDDIHSQVEAERWARNTLGTKGIQFGVEGTNTCGSDVYAHLKAEALKLTGDIRFASRASHSLPPEPIVETPENIESTA
jgi:hypothetical protein